MKRINKADIQIVNTSLNTLSVAKHMLSADADTAGKRYWAERGFNAMTTLKEYGIFAGAGSEDYWTGTFNAYKAL